jgi:hypothetical protein
MEGSKRKVFAAMAALAVAVSGCGSSTKASSSEPDATTASASTDTPTPAPTPCTKLKQPYGSPPGGFKYEKADASTRAKTITALGIQSDGVDMRLARRGGITLGSLVGISSGDPGDYVSTVLGRAQSSGTKIEKDAGFSVITVPNGADIAIGVKGCRAVMITSQDPNGVRYLASAVFAS